LNEGRKKAKKNATVKEQKYYQDTKGSSW